MAANWELLEQMIITNCFWPIFFFFFLLLFVFDQWKRMFSTKKLFKGHYQSEDDDNDDGGVWTQQHPSDFFLVKLIPVNHFVKQTEFQMSFCCFFYWQMAQLLVVVEEEEKTMKHHRKQNRNLLAIHKLSTITALARIIHIVFCFRKKPK